MKIYLIVSVSLPLFCVLARNGHVTAADYDEEDVSRVSMEISIGGKKAGSLLIVLRKAFLPVTVFNFEFLCTGALGFGYKNSKFHRLIPGFVLQGGDITSGDGFGGKSVFGDIFLDESFYFNHSKRGVVSMANAGDDSNGSQFIITLAVLPQLDGEQVVFGEVEGKESFALLDKIEKLETDADEKPKKDVVVTNCSVKKGTGYQCKAKA